MKRNQRKATEAAEHPPRIRDVASPGAQTRKGARLDPPQVRVSDQIEGLSNQERIHALGQRGGEATAPIGSGEPISPGVRWRMERALGHDLGDIRLHTDDNAKHLAAQEGARAGALGQDLVFGAGEYRPGTLIGDALLAHELAHAAQAREPSASSASEAAVERDANRVAFEAVANLWGVATRAASTVHEHAPMRVGRRLALRRCTQESRIEPPDYLGEHSLNTLRSLNDRLGNLELLGPVIAAGTAVVVGAGPPSDPSGNVESAAEALRALPAIQRAVINQEIDLLYIQHGNDLTREERGFWDRIRAGTQ